jgi:hypothetical protein
MSLVRILAREPSSLTENLIFFSVPLDEWRDSSLAQCTNDFFRIFSIRLLIIHRYKAVNSECMDKEIIHKEMSNLRQDTALEYARAASLSVF